MVIYHIRVYNCTRYLLYGKEVSIVPLIQWSIKSAIYLLCKFDDSPSCIIVNYDSVLILQKSLQQHPTYWSFQRECRSLLRTCRSLPSRQHPSNSQKSAAILSSSCTVHYLVAKTHRMPYLYRSFSAKEPYN